MCSYEEAVYPTAKKNLRKTVMYSEIAHTPDVDFHIISY